MEDIDDQEMTRCGLGTDGGWHSVQRGRAGVRRRESEKVYMRVTEASNGKESLAGSQIETRP